MPRPVTVTATRRLTPRLVSITVTGDDLGAYATAAPTSHLKVFFPGPDGSLELPTPGPDGPVWPQDGPRPTVRTYTPRCYDADTNSLAIEFVLHGTGPAAHWAAHAEVGDRLAVAGPGGRFTLDPTVVRWKILGDESALPAIATLLEALPTSATADVHLEVEDDTDHIALRAPDVTNVTWHHREGAGYGTALVQAARALTVDPDARVWVACEAQTVRQIRRELLGAGHDQATLTTRGYWRAGEENHPDHDYGDD